MGLPSQAPIGSLPTRSNRIWVSAAQSRPTDQRKDTRSFIAGVRPVRTAPPSSSQSYAHPLAEPSIFVKIVTYGFVAMVQVMALFLLSQAVEERIRNSEYDPAWR